MAKKRFKFRVADSRSYSEDEIELFKDDLEIYSRLLEQRDNFYTSQVPVERMWRNQELALTDFMMASDATYDGVTVQGSAYGDDILAYRKALREYDMAFGERPTRPDWFKG